MSIYRYHVHVYIYIYIYICIERERGRDIGWIRQKNDFGVLVLWILNMWTGRIFTAHAHEVYLQPKIIEYAMSSFNMPGDCAMYKEVLQYTRNSFNIQWNPSIYKEILQCTRKAFNIQGKYWIYNDITDDIFGTEPRLIEAAVHTYAKKKCYDLANILILCYIIG